MALLSYNSVNNKRLQSTGFGKPVKIAVVLLAVFMAGYFLPTIKNKLTYQPAENKAKQFLNQVLAGDYDSAQALGTEEFRTEYDSGDKLKQAMGDLKTDKPKYGEKQTAGEDNIFVYTQVVDNLPPTENGVTDAVFTVSLNKTNQNWEVFSVAVN